MEVGGEVGGFFEVVKTTLAEALGGGIDYGCGEDEFVVDGLPGLGLVGGHGEAGAGLGGDGGAGDVASGDELHGADVTGTSEEEDGGDEEEEAGDDGGVCPLADHAFFGGGEVVADFGEEGAFGSDFFDGVSADAVFVF